MAAVVLIASAATAEESDWYEPSFSIRLEPFSAPSEDFAAGFIVAPDTSADAQEPAGPPHDAVTRETSHSTTVLQPVAEAKVRGLRLTDIFPLCECDESLDGVPLLSDQQRRRIISLMVGYDAFRGIPDGSWTNSGIHTGANFGTRLGPVSDWTGIGLQVGGSVGAYDWAGTDYRMRNQNKAQVQAFITYGLFRRSHENSRWSLAVVQDWMLNNTYSVFGENPTFSQLRGQVAYATSACNEFGLWGACRLIDDTRRAPGFGSVTWRPINQLNVFWHHKWGLNAPDTWVSIGVPEDDRLNGRGSLGDYIANALAICPLSDRVAVYSSVMYMHQSGSPGPAASLEEAWNFTVGIAVYPRANSRTRSVAGHRWAPLLPVANNGSFLIDASATY